MDEARRWVARDHSAVTTTLVAGLAAGLGDFAFALLYYGAKLSVFQNVAAGVIGVPSARAGGVVTFAVGVALHFVVATGWAALYVFGSSRVPSLRTHPVVGGVAYGAVVFYAMNCLVLPLSALRTSPWPPPWAPVPLVMHMLVVGLPISFIAGGLRRVDH